MGLLEKILKKPEPQQNPQGFFKTLTAYRPAFTTFSGGLYESDLVRAAINARATHISKLEVIVNGTSKPRLQTRLKLGPNAFQTWSQFLYRLSTILDVQNTAFIVPVLDQYGDVTGIFPVLPTQCTIVQYGGEPFLRYEFQTGQHATIEMSACGVMTRFQYKDDFFGEKNGALFPTMQLVDIQNQGIQEGVKSSATYRFMAQLSNFAKAEDLAKERKRFTAENLTSDDTGGLLLFPNTYSNIQQIQSKPFVVDAEQMKLIQTNVYNYFGVNEKVLQNTAASSELDAFFNGAIEPFSIQLSDVLTKMLFTESERERGTKVWVSANRLQYMSVAEKVSMAQQLGDRGMITINEARALFNYPPIDGGEQAPIRGEYYMTGEKTDDGES